jgi:hypothetical protein
VEVPVAQITATLSVVEALWTLFALVGLYYVGGRLLPRSLGDLKALGWRKERDPRRVLAVLRVRHHLAYALVFAGFAVIGVAAGLSEPGGVGGNEPRSFVLAAGLLGAQFLMVADAWWEERTIERLVRAPADPTE